jgi:subtilisin family serine protease
MSAPVTSGVVALWMQDNPQLTALQIIDIMKETCDNDEWTTDVSKIPSHNKVQAGFGKLNCLKGLKKILGTNAISVAGSDGDRHATPATMYSVDAPVYNTMGQQVDKSHKGLVIYKGKKYLQQ